MSHNDIRLSESTNALIGRLAAQAGEPSGGRLQFSAVLPVALIAALIAAVVVVLSSAGARSDLFDILPTWMFMFKVAGMLLLAAGGLRLVRAAVRPGDAVSPVFYVGPGAIFLLAGALLDPSGFPLLGVHTYSAFNCASIIIASSIPALLLVLAVMRKGTPTRLVQAGAIAGLLSGSIGALAYTIACLNDGAAFVALWYSAAILVVTIIGALAGPKALAW